MSRRRHGKTWNDQLFITIGIATCIVFSGFFVLSNLKAQIPPDGGMQQMMGEGRGDMIQPMMGEGRGDMMQQMMGEGRGDMMQPMDGGGQIRFDNGGMPPPMDGGGQIRFDNGGMPPPMDGGDRRFEFENERPPVMMDGDRQRRFDNGGMPPPMDGGDRRFEFENERPPVMMDGDTQRLDDPYNRPVKKEHIRMEQRRYEDNDERPVIDYGQERLNDRDDFRNAAGDDFEDRFEQFYDEGFMRDDMTDRPRDMMDKKKMMQMFSERGYKDKDMTMMEKMTSSTMREYIGNMAKDQEGRPHQGNDLIRYASDTGLDTGVLEELLEAKNNLLKEIENLKTQIASVRQELSDILAQAKEYNFGSRTGEKAKVFLRDQLPTLSRQEAEEKLSELKGEARQEKFENGVIGFLDADDDQWFGIHALKAKKLGLVKGVDETGTRLDPERATNVAEAIMMFARVNGIDPNARPSSRVGQDLPEWARAAAGSLENKGVNLDDIFNAKSASDGASRGEVARLLDDVLDLPDASGDTARSFSDIGAASQQEAKAIAAVKEAGIMTGYGDSDAFGVRDDLNRAALVKTLTTATDVIGDIY